MFARLDFPRFLVCCSGDLSDNESEEKPSVAICGGSICILTGLILDIDTNEITQMPPSLYFEIDELKTLRNTTGANKQLSILSMNIQSIHAKFQELEVFIETLQNEDFKFNIICLQECWLPEQAEYNCIQLPGYDCVAQGRSSNYFKYI